MQKHQFHASDIINSHVFSAILSMHAKKMAISQCVIFLQSVHYFGVKVQILE